MTKVCQLLLIGWRVNKNLMTASRNWSSERNAWSGHRLNQEFFCKILRHWPFLENRLFMRNWRGKNWRQVNHQFFAIEDLLSCYFPNYSLWQIFSEYSIIFQLFLIHQEVWLKPNEKFNLSRTFGEQISFDRLGLPFLEIPDSPFPRKSVHGYFQNCIFTVFFNNLFLYS